MSERGGGIGGDEMQGGAGERYSRKDAGGWTDGDGRVREKEREKDYERSNEYDVAEATERTARSSAPRCARAPETKALPVDPDFEDLSEV